MCTAREMDAGSGTLVPMESAHVVRLALASLVLATLSAGCDCAGSGPRLGDPCSTSADCGSRLVCVDRTCQEPGDAGARDAAAGDASGDAAMCTPERTCRSGTLCCAEGEECVDGRTCAPVCANTRCGDNRLTCCDAGEVCLDDIVCAADCAADRPVCGASLELCCDAGQVCIAEACVTPGDACTDDYDCLTEGTYCEHTIGRCLELPPPPLCEVRPDFDQVALEVEWHWTGVDVGGTTYRQVAAAPVVGDVSGDGIPDVIVPVYAGSNLDNAVLVAIHGGTGETLWTISGTGEPESLATAAIGNLDPADEALEIVYRLDSTGLRVVDGDGVTELARQTTGSGATTRVVSPALADMDHDGDIEIVAGCQVLSLEGAAGAFTLRQLFDAGTCAEPSQTHAAVTVANLDDDPDLEITSGGAAFDTDGRLMWPAMGVAQEHGHPAVADLDGDGLPEVINVRSGALIVRDGATGVVRVGAGGTWYASNVPIPGGGNGGPPTVADFDGDGLPEIASAGRGQYAVYDPDCLATPPRAGGDCTPGTTNFLRWSAVTQDISSSVTGSSVFDFQGDGVAEAIYNDECWLHIYDGRTGDEVLMMPRPNSSRTAMEYPLVVDVDRDGNSEIVVPANNDQAVSRDNCDDAYSAEFGVPIAMLDPEFRTGTFGIYAFGDPMDRWVRTRRIWNQFTYHVTNVEELGGIPRDEVANWSVPGLNNFRTNVQGEGVFNAPNLTVELEIVALCGDRSLRLSAVVTNAGSRGVPAGVPVEFVRTMPEPMASVGSAMTTRPLLPGASERVTITVPDVPFDTELVFSVTVDGASATMPVLECNEDDNGATGMEMCLGFG